MKPQTKATAKTAASAKASLKQPVKPSKMNSHKLASNHNETFLVR
jgi:hypothetical protein